MDTLKQLATAQGAIFFQQAGCEMALMPSYRDPQELFFGFFCWDLQDLLAAEQLLSDALNWAKKQNYQSIIGPININTWFDYRFKIDQGTHPHNYFWEPSNPPEYVELFLKHGFTTYQSYSTIATANLSGMLKRIEQSTNAAAQQGYSVRPIDMSNLDREIDTLYKISLEGFKDNFLFAPITQEHFRQLYTAGKSHVDFSYSAFIQTAQQEEVGFFFVFAQDQYIVMKSTTILPEHRGKGLSNAVLGPAFRRAIREKKEGHISALMIAGAQSTSYSRHGDFLWEHRYALLQKILD
jgi:GNAT superfamily N-acetyltransferase